MPILAPWLRSLLLLLGCASAVEVDVAEDVVDSGFGSVGDVGVSEVGLGVVLVLAVDGLPVFRLQVTGLALLSMATLKVPLRAKGGPRPTAGSRESSKWQLNGSSA